MTITFALLPLCGQVLLDIVCNEDDSGGTELEEEDSGDDGGLVTSPKGGCGATTVAVAWSFAIISFLATADVGFAVHFDPAQPSSQPGGGDASSAPSNAPGEAPGEPPGAGSGVGSGAGPGAPQAVGLRPGREVVRAFSRTASEPERPCRGDFTTRRSGTLVLCWDNSYSVKYQKRAAPRPSCT